MQRAGAKVIGVDHKPQKRFPGICLQADVPALRGDKKFIAWARCSFNFVWASPPCQFGTELRHAPNAKEHENLIPATRELLEIIGLPYAIENVEGAKDHLRNPIYLEGSMFGLGVRLTGGGCSYWFRLERRRFFETSWQLSQPADGETFSPVIGVYGGHARVRAASIPGGRGSKWPFEETQKYAAEHAMGVVGENLTLAEMSQGIPPAYSEYILRSFYENQRS